eukprot:9493341-Pyramimonas_sp.AAC.2
MNFHDLDGVTRAAAAPSGSMSATLMHSLSGGNSKNSLVQGPTRITQAPLAKARRMNWHTLTYLTTQLNPGSLAERPWSSGARGHSRGRAIQRMPPCFNLLITDSARSEPSCVDMSSDAPLDLSRPSAL